MRFTKKLRPDAPGGDELKETRLDRGVLVRTAMCVIPAMGCVGLGQLSIGGKWFYTSLLFLLAHYLITKDRLGFVSLVVSLIPALMLLRALFFYNFIIVILATGIALWFFTSPKEFSQLLREVRYRWLLLLGVMYWLSSYLWTGSYVANLRVLELVFSAVSIYLIAKHRNYLASALTGVSISVFMIGLAFLPQGGDRLGMAGVEGYNLGNPISFGIPLALTFLLSIADNGRWLLLEKHYQWRIALALTSAAFLLLSTSRGSLAIVVVNVIVLLTNGKRQRKILFLLMALLVLLTVALLATERGQYIVAFYDKTFGAERTMAQRTTGRSDQWKIFPRVFMDSPLWGFGPGTGYLIYGQYSQNEKDLDLRGNIQWHSLYLQIGVETGTIGLILLTLLLATLIVRGLIHWRLSGNSVPLIGVLGFMVIGMSVSAIDAVSGIFLGLGFLSVKSRSARHVQRTNDNRNLALQIAMRYGRAAAINPLARSHPDAPRRP